ncbi:MAG: serine/threonine protein kinase [Candidatus Obscuribacter sp.]|nr:serine/threonine protein kinase [Candidatus Obscuribacter sp.]
MAERDMSSHKNPIDLTVGGQDFVLQYVMVNSRMKLTFNFMMGLAVLLTFGMMIYSYFRYPTFHRHWFSYVGMLIPLSALLPIYYFANLKNEAVLKLSASGLQFSPVWKHCLLNRMERSWSDVHSVQVTYPESMGRSSSPHFKGERIGFNEYMIGMGISANVSFDFKSGGTADIALHFLTRKQAEEFFAAIERFCDSSRFSSDFVKMQKAILLERLDGQSFTQLWAEDLSPRYVSTNYVPLPTAHSLQEGRYKVLMELAAGGMSAVYLARRDSGAKVVLKESVLPADIGPEQQAKARELFERESVLLLKLHHPQIARVLDRFVEDDRDYLVLEYIPGLTLRQLVKAKGKQKEKDVINWASQLAEILVYLHGQKPPVLHRDLTPDNIILQDDGKLCLVDFGAANEFVGQATGTMVGKQCYIAPEQLRGKATPLSDLYALGGTLFFLLTGTDPEPLASSIARDVCPDVSQSTSDFIARLTAFESGERITDAESVRGFFKAPTSNRKGGQIDVS